LLFPPFLAIQKRGRWRQGSYFYRKTFSKPYCGNPSSVGLRADSSFSKEPAAAAGRETRVYALGYFLKNKEKRIENKE
jgi:hypothetical protein